MNAGLIWGKDHSYALQAPKGWVLDNKAGVGQGSQAVFYPKGGSWAKSPAVMYTTVAMVNSYHKTIDQVVNHTFKKFKAASPNIKVRDHKVIKIGKKKAIIKEWVNNLKNYEVVAYIQESNVVVIVTLTSKDKEKFKQSLKSFYELIRSYKYISDKVKYSTPK